MYIYLYISKKKRSYVQPDRHPERGVNSAVQDILKCSGLIGLKLSTENGITVELSNYHEKNFQWTGFKETPWKIDSAFYLYKPLLTDRRPNKDEL